MVSIADRPIFFVHQTQKKNIDKYQKNRVCFILTPNITVEYTQTPKTVKIPVSVNDFFKSELKGFPTISTTYRRNDDVDDTMLMGRSRTTTATARRALLLHCCCICSRQ